MLARLKLFLKNDQFRIPNIVFPNTEQNYAYRGYHFGNFLPGPIFDKFISLLKDVKNGNLKPGYELKERYERSLDIFPSSVEYDPTFYTVLKESKINELIKSICGESYTLSNIQTRISLPGASYMDWHRDTYFHGGKQVGNFPAVHKLIYYLPENTTSTPRLEIISGSHRTTLYSEKADAKLIKSNGSVQFSDSPIGYVFLDTSALHSVVAESNPTGSLRVIWAFMNRNQLQDGSRDKEVSQRYETL